MMSAHRPREVSIGTQHLLQVPNILEQTALPLGRYVWELSKLAVIHDELVQFMMKS